MGAGLDTQQPPLPPGRRPVAPPLDFKTGRPVQTPKPLPISKGGKPIFAPLPDKKTGRPIPRPPIDMVRDPRFGSALDQRNYGNLLNDIIARIGAERGDQGQQAGGGKVELDRYGFTKRDPRSPDTMYGGPAPRPQAPSQPRPSGPDFVDNRKPGMNYTMNMIDYIDPATGEKASRTKGIVPGPGSRFVPAYQANLYRELLKTQGPQAGGDFPQGRYGIPEGPQVGGNFTQGRLMGAPTNQPNPNAGKPQYFQALEGELQRQFLDQNPQLKLKPETMPTSQFMQENYAKFLQNQMAEVNKFNAANPQYALDIQRPNPALARQTEQSFLEGLLDYSKVSPSQVNVLNQLKSGYLNEGQGGGTRPQIPQNAMATYNNLLQQGIQRSNTMNQDAASNFANMQAGAPIPQPATPAKANPTMPIAGLGMQQPRATPVPRKFSTVNTPSARFG